VIVPFTVSPNPSPGSFRFVLGEIGQGAAEISVFDIGGRRVRAFDLVAPGSTVIWDGTNTTGLPVASGTYFVRLEIGERVDTRRVLLLR
jgi:hypothetical protein